MASVGTKRKRNGTPRIAPTWRRLECTGSASPAARSGFGFARVIGHGLVVFGGISSSGYLDDVWLLQCAVTKRGAALGAADGKNGAAVASPSPLSGKWTRLDPSGPKPTALGYCSMAAIGSRVYLYGGVSDGFQFHNDVWMLDIAPMGGAGLAWKRVEPARARAPFPAARCACAVQSCGELLVVFGGLGRQNKLLNDVWVFDTRLRAWMRPSTRGTPPCPRRNPGSAVACMRLAIVGGVNSGGQDKNDLYTLDLSTWTWSVHSSGAVSEQQPVTTTGSLLLWAPPYLILHGGLTAQAASGALNIRTMQSGAVWAAVESEAGAARGMHGGMAIEGGASGDPAGTIYVVLFGGTDNKADLGTTIFAKLQRPDAVDSGQNSRPGAEKRMCPSTALGDSSGQSKL